MNTRSLIRSGLALSTAAVLCLSLPAVSAQAAPPPGAPYSTDTSAELLHVNAIGLTGLPAVADAGVAVATGSVDTEATGAKSIADARNLDASLLGADLDGLLSSSHQEAPPDNPTPDTDSIIPTTNAVLFSLGLSETSAQARYDADNCLTTGQALSDSQVSTANVALLDVPMVGSLLALPGTVSTRQASAMVPSTTTDGDDLVSAAVGSAASVELLDGEVKVQVATAPALVARVSGSPGGADVEYTAPVVTVEVAGEPFVLPVDGSPLDITAPDNPLLQLELSLGQLENEQEAADGTSASGEASVLHVRVALGAAPLAVELLDVDLFPFEVSATTAAGGIDCGDPTNPGGMDSDGDGLTDDEETTGSENDNFNNEPTDPQDADSDNDGVNDGDETDNGTDPNNADTDGGGVDDGDEDTNGTDPLDPTDDNPGSTDDDPDMDGLTNDEEAAAGTDPNVRDTDGDGLIDGLEVKVTKTDPLDRDTDDDRLSDGAEYYKFDTNPLRKDTDRDGLKDGREVKKLRTNPLRKDTDRDGLNDKVEVKGSANKRYDRCPTNPRRKDTDRDGLNDKAEIRRFKTNPCDRDTDNGGISDGNEVKAGSDPLDKKSGPRNPRSID